MAEALQAADAAFAQTGDVLEALRWIQLAMGVRMPVPPRLALWVRVAIEQYLEGRAPTLDSALGLRKAGKADPRRKARERAVLVMALAKMAVLQLEEGITIDAAATRVGQEAHLSDRTLRNRYVGSSLSKYVQTEKRTAKGYGKVAVSRAWKKK